MKIGILALQGDVAEHVRAIERVGAEPVLVKRPAQLAQVDALVLPVGESPTITKLLKTSGLDQPLRDRLAQGMPVFGTCAGLILLARETGDPQVPGLCALDVTVRRNAYGRQIDSFETTLSDHALGGAPLEAVFIRAPGIEDVGPDVEVIASRDGQPVAVRQGNAIGAAFHPELTDDTRLYEALIDAVRASKRSPARDDAA